MLSSTAGARALRGVNASPTVDICVSDWRPRARARRGDGPRVVGLGVGASSDLLSLLDLAELQQLDDSVAAKERRTKGQPWSRGGAEQEEDARVLGGAEDGLELLLGRLAELAGGALSREEDVVGCGWRGRRVR